MFFKTFGRRRELISGMSIMDYAIWIPEHQFFRLGYPSLQKICQVIPSLSPFVADPTVKLDPESEVPDYIV